MRVAVAGGTGLTGRHVVDALTRSGHDPVVVARSTGVDLVTGDGLDAALDGVEAVVDATNAPSQDETEASDFFEAATGGLAEAAGRAGIGHLVVLSIVGIDELAATGASPFTAHYRAKVRQEAAAASGSVPLTVLRATQFHDFPGMLLDWSDDQVVEIPEMVTSTVAVAEVGAWLAEIAVGPATGRLEVGGPATDQMVELVARTAAARDDDREVRSVRVPGEAGHLLSDGVLVPDDPWRRGATTFEAWLGGAEA